MGEIYNYVSFMYFSWVNVDSGPISTFNGSKDTECGFDAKLN